MDPPPPRLLQLRRRPHLPPGQPHRQLDLFYADLFYLYLLQRFSDDSEAGGCGAQLRQETLGALATIT